MQSPPDGKLSFSPAFVLDVDVEASSSKFSITQSDNSLLFLEDGNDRAVGGDEGHLLMAQLCLCGNRKNELQERKRDDRTHIDFADIVTISDPNYSYDE